MSRPSQAVLKALTIYRDEEAFNRNLPLFKVMGNKTLLQIAERLPRDSRSLSKIRGMNSRQIQRHGSNILDIVQKYRRGPFPERPRGRSGAVRGLGHTEPAGGVPGRCGRRGAAE